MSWFARIEETCAAFIERAFANMFPSDLEPAQIARKLVATMEARTQYDDGRMTAPARYAVRVHPADFERLSENRAYLEVEWAALLTDVAQRVGIELADAAPSVELCPGNDTVAGAVDVEAVEPGQEAVVPRLPRQAFRLQTVRGMPPDAVYEVSGAARVGRNRESDIFLVDPSVSRNHALLDVRNGALVVRDAGSTNGTFVNGERVQLRTLNPGDIVAFGKTELRVEDEP